MRTYGVGVRVVDVRELGVLSELQALLTVVASELLTSAQVPEPTKSNRQVVEDFECESLS